MLDKNIKEKGKFHHCTRISKCEFQGLSYSILAYGYTEWNVPFIRDSGNFQFEAVGYKDDDILGGVQGHLITGMTLIQKSSLVAK